MTHDRRPTQDPAMCQRSRQTSWLNAPWSVRTKCVDASPSTMEGGYSPMNGLSLQGWLSIGPAPICLTGFAEPIDHS
jgi:hypothetical protein